ncbi:MAG TPA: M20/M25/M40 family metallo-hydrolase, partial [Burkholderiales bacterium]|nr:M20/M25/M40 family metallo-hydrolase [Burkholderiales bacterium]
MLEDIVVDSVSSQNVRARVEYICSNLPSRLAGSDNGRKMAEYNADALRSVGVAAQVQEFQALVSFPRPARLRIAQPSPASIDAFTLGHSIATGESGVEGELVYVGPGAIKDYDGVDVRGRIVLCELSYSPARMEKQRIAAARGAIGAVMMNWGYPDDTAVPFGSVKPLWGNPTPETVRDQMPTLPCVGISRKAGLALKALCTRSPTRVLISTDVDNVWRPVHLTTGEISAPASEDFVIVGGHQDSWFGPAATDNAAGNACMVELARVFNAHREHLKRGIVFGFWTAHETGTMAGSAYFVDTQWDRLREHALAYLLIDQPACTGTT